MSAMGQFFLLCQPVAAFLIIGQCACVCVCLLVCVCVSFCVLCVALLVKQDFCLCPLKASEAGQETGKGIE